MAGVAGVRVNEGCRERSASEDLAAVALAADALAADTLAATFAAAAHALFALDLMALFHVTSFKKGKRIGLKHSGGG